MWNSFDIFYVYTFPFLSKLNIINFHKKPRITFKIKRIICSKYWEKYNFDFDL